MPKPSNAKERGPEPDSPQRHITALPSAALGLIIQQSLLLDSTLLGPLLNSLGLSISTATRSTLLNSIIINDADAELVAAETAPASVGDGGRCLLNRVWNNDEYALQVHQLAVGPPGHSRSIRKSRPPLSQAPGPGGSPVLTSSSGGLPPASSSLASPFEPFSLEDAGSPLEASSEEGDTSRSDLDASPAVLEDTAFYLLVSKLANLTSFVWSSHRVPPAALCAVLGHTAKGLLSFRVALVADPSLTSPALGSLGAAPSSEAIRWDALDIGALPGTITSLSLSHLSARGAKSLAAALESLCFSSLEKLELVKTRFIDDTFMEALAEGCRRLVVLNLVDLSGTKLTDQGFLTVFTASDMLEELSLEDLQGRLSRGFWKKLVPCVPDCFKKIRISYTAQGPHHSWVVDHLESLSALCALPGMRAISVTRVAQTVKDGETRATIADAVLPKPLPRDMLTSIIGRTEDLRVLELDYWEMNLTYLKAYMESGTGLVQLRVLLDEPFKAVLTLAASFAFTTQLRSFVVTITPRHMVELSQPAVSYGSHPLPPRASIDLASSSYKSTSASSDIATSPASPTSIRSANLFKSTSQEMATQDQMPPLRDWRRLLKKSQRLEVIKWTDVGKWRVSRGGVGSSVKVEYEPCTKDTAEENAAGDDEPGSVGAYQSRIVDGFTTYAGVHSRFCSDARGETRTRPATLVGSSLANFCFAAPASLVEAASPESGVGLGLGEMSSAGGGSAGSRRRRSSAVSTINANAPALSLPLSSISGNPMVDPRSFPQLTATSPKSPSSPKRTLPAQHPGSPSTSRMHGTNGSVSALAGVNLGGRGVLEQNGGGGTRRKSVPNSAKESNPSTGHVRGGRRPSMADDDGTAAGVGSGRNGRKNGSPQSPNRSRS